MRTMLRSLAVALGIGLALPGMGLTNGLPVSDILVIAPNERTSIEFSRFIPLTVVVSEPDPVLDPLVIGVRNPSHLASFNTAVGLTEPGHPHVLSDIIEFSIVANPDGVQTWTPIFSSDLNEGPLVPPTDVFLVTVPETGGLQDISDLFLDSDGVTRLVPLFTVRVRSDVPVGIPAPAALLLLSAGVAGLVGLARRRG